MDYEKAYKEAIERAKNYCNGHHTDVSPKAMSEYLFPELKEGEDERIRKALLEYFGSYHSGSAITNDVVVEDVLVWLEKQKPLNNFDEAEKEKNDFVSGQFIECRKSFNEFKEFESYWLEYVGDDIYIGRSDNVLNQKFHITPRQLFTFFTHQHCPKENNDEQKENNWNDMIKDLDKVEEYVLSLAPNMPLDAVKVHAKNIRFLVNDGQKPKTTPQWMIDFLDEYRRKIGCSMDYDEIRDTDGKVLAIVNWMKGNPNIQQKPIEWSKEDEKILSKIQDHLREFYVDKKGYPYIAASDSPEMIEFNWLKSLKDRVQPQPKQDSSDEDKVWIDRACMLLDELNHLNTLTLAKIPHNVNEIISHIKSINPHPQPKQEWSEFDNDMMNAIICLTKQGRHLEEEHINWLKSLKDRVQPQPKQGWNEDDEKTIDEAISLINTLASGYGENMAEPITFSGVKMINDIKERLRNLHQKPNHWKPSEEQMDALDKAKNSPANYYDIRLGLQSLYNDLLKL